MFQRFKNPKQKSLSNIVSIFIIFCFSLSSVAPSYAQSLSVLPAPGTMIMQTPGFSPVLVRALEISPENPLQFGFIVDNGDTGFEGEELTQETKKLIRYFLASLTTPEKDMWVNLSPYEENRIIADNFGETQMGRDLLAQDYILKQLTASLIYPEDELGKKFWDKIYKTAYEKFGTTDIPLNTFNKVWIVPKTAEIYEHDNKVFVINSELEIMMEEDYLSLEKNLNREDLGAKQTNKAEAKSVSAISSEIVREIVIPAITKEVNEGKNFANLRQIYNAMILATWYKKNLKESLLGKVYVDQSKNKGIDLKDKQASQKVYDQYIEAFKKGVYDYIKVESDSKTGRNIPRKYFSGGALAVSSMRNVIPDSNDLAPNGDVVQNYKFELVENANEGEAGPAVISSNMMIQNILSQKTLTREGLHTVLSAIISEAEKDKSFEENERRDLVFIRDDGQKIGLKFLSEMDIKVGKALLGDEMSGKFKEVIVEYKNNGTFFRLLIGTKSPFLTDSFWEVASDNEGQNEALKKAIQNVLGLKKSVRHKIRVSSNLVSQINKKIGTQLPGSLTSEDAQKKACEILERFSPHAVTKTAFDINGNMEFAHFEVVDGFWIAVSGGDFSSMSSGDGVQTTASSTLASVKTIQDIAPLAIELLKNNTTALHVSLLDDGLVSAGYLPYKEFLNNAPEDMEALPLARYIQIDLNFNSMFYDSLITFQIDDEGGVVIHEVSSPKAENQKTIRKIFQGILDGYVGNLPEIQGDGYTGISSSNLKVRINKQIEGDESISPDLSPREAQQKAMEKIEGLQAGALGGNFFDASDKLGDYRFSVIDGFWKVTIVNEKPAKNQIKASNNLNANNIQKISSQKTMNSAATEAERLVKAALNPRIKSLKDFQKVSWSNDLRDSGWTGIDDYMHESYAPWKVKQRLGQLSIEENAVFIDTDNKKIIQAKDILPLFGEVDHPEVYRIFFKDGSRISLLSKGSGASAGAGQKNSLVSTLGTAKDIQSNIKKQIFFKKNSLSKKVKLGKTEVADPKSIQTKLLEALGKTQNDTEDSNLESDWVYMSLKNGDFVEMKKSSKSPAWKVRKENLSETAREQVMVDQAQSIKNIFEDEKAEINVKDGFAFNGSLVQIYSPANELTLVAYASTVNNEVDSAFLHKGKITEDIPLIRKSFTPKKIEAPAVGLPLGPEKKPLVGANFIVPDMHMTLSAILNAAQVRKASSTLSLKYPGPFNVSSFVAQLKASLEFPTYFLIKVGKKEYTEGELLKEELSLKTGEILELSFSENRFSARQINLSIQKQDGSVLISAKALAQVGEPSFISYPKINQQVARILDFETAFDYLQSLKAVNPPSGRAIYDRHAEASKKATQNKQTSSNLNTKKYEIKALNHAQFLEIKEKAKKGIDILGIKDFKKATWLDLLKAVFLKVSFDVSDRISSKFYNLKALADGIFNFEFLENDKIVVEVSGANDLSREYSLGILKKELGLQDDQIFLKKTSSSNMKLTQKFINTFRREVSDIDELLNFRRFKISLSKEQVDGIKKALGTESLKSMGMISSGKDRQLSDDFNQPTGEDSFVEFYVETSDSKWSETVMKIKSEGAYLRFMVELFNKNSDLAREVIKDMLNQKSVKYFEFMVNFIKHLEKRFPDNKLMLQMNSAEKLEGSAGFISNRNKFINGIVERSTIGISFELNDEELITVMSAQGEYIVTEYGSWLEKYGLPNLVYGLVDYNDDMNLKKKSTSSNIKKDTKEIAGGSRLESTFDPVAVKTTHQFKNGLHVDWTFEEKGDHAYDSSDQIFDSREAGMKKRKGSSVMVKQEFSVSRAGKQGILDMRSSIKKNPRTIAGNIAKVARLKDVDLRGLDDNLYGDELGFSFNGGSLTVNYSKSLGNSAKITVQVNEGEESEVTINRIFAATCEVLSLYKRSASSAMVIKMYKAKNRASKWTSIDDEDVKEGKEVWFAGQIIDNTEADGGWERIVNFRNKSSLVIYRESDGLLSFVISADSDDIHKSILEGVMDEFGLLKEEIGETVPKKAGSNISTIMYQVKELNSDQLAIVVNEIKAGSLSFINPKSLVMSIAARLNLKPASTIGNSFVTDKIMDVKMNFWDSIADGHQKVKIAIVDEKELLITVEATDDQKHKLLLDAVKSELRLDDDQMDLKKTASSDIVGYRKGPGEDQGKIVKPIAPGLPQGHRTVSGYSNRIVKPATPGLPQEHRTALKKKSSSQAIVKQVNAGIGNQLRGEDYTSEEAMKSAARMLGYEPFVFKNYGFQIRKDGVYVSFDLDEGVYRAVHAATITDQQLKEMGDPDLRKRNEKASSNLGGIRLDSKYLDLQIKRDGKGIALPVSSQPLESFNIQGFSFYIMSITAVPSLLLMSGISDSDSREASLDSEFDLQAKAVNRFIVGDSRRMSILA